MYSEKRRSFFSTTLPLFLALGVAYAGDRLQDDQGQGHRQQDAHVHGVGQLNLVLEGDLVYLELHVPAANIVGFEHTPASAAEHAALDRAVAALEDGDRLFRFDDAAGCRMAEAEIDTSLMEADHQVQAGHGHEHERAGEHAHGESDDHGARAETHSDVAVAYRFECAHPERLSRLNVELFQVFPGSERLNVQFVVGGRQGAVELTGSRPVVNF